MSWFRHTRFILIFALLINVIVVGSLFWAGKGQRTAIVLETTGNSYRAFVDGKLRAEGVFEGSQDTFDGLLLILEESSAGVPSLPKPRGIDSIQVTDTRSGVTLVRDDFDSLDTDRWQVLSGKVAIDQGVLTALAGSQLVLSNVGARDYTVRLSAMNLTAAQIGLRAKDAQNAVIYNLRPYRHYDNGWALVESGRVIKRIPGQLIQAAPAEVLKSIILMSLKPYKLLPLAAGIGFVIVFGLSMLPAQVRLPTFPEKVVLALVATLTACVVAVLLYLSREYNELIPHVPDEVSYIFQAKVLASGHITAPSAPVKDAFEFFYPALIYTRPGHWASQYPFGHPLVLALGVPFGAIWAVPVVIGGFCVGLVYATGRALYSKSVGVIAALLLATSPFFLMTASNLMSHNTAAFFLLASLLLTVKRDRPVLYGLLAGMFFGLLFNTRPLTALSLIPPFGLLLVARLLPASGRRANAKHLAAFLAGGLLMAGACIAYNYAITGDPFKSPYETWGSVSSWLGFSGRHSFEVGLQNEQTQLSTLLLVFNGWPFGIGLVLVFLPFLLGTRSRWDYFLLACACCDMAAYTLYEGHGLMHGPRYWYEAMPFLVLLAARGADQAIAVLTQAVRLARSMLSWTESFSQWPAPVAVWIGLIVLTFVGLNNWLLAKDADWRIDAVPATARELRGFNGINSALLKRLDDAELTNALVLVQPCGNWQCYGNVFWLNEPELNGNVVYARDLPERNAETLAAFPQRRVYQATYSPASLRPFGSLEELRGNNSNEAPLANNIMLASPVAGAAEPLLEADRDATRIQHLEELRAALLRFRESRGTFPRTESVQSLCLFAWDAGCVLRDFLSPLPTDPSATRPYWYQSDGAWFMLFASLEGQPHGSDCPNPIPSHLAGEKNLFCVTGP